MYCYSSGYRSIREALDALSSYPKPIIHPVSPGGQSHWKIYFFVYPLEIYGKLESFQPKKKTLRARIIYIYSKKFRWCL